METSAAAASNGSHDRVILLSVAPDIYLKSPRTQRRLRRILSENLQEALARRAPGVELAGGPPGRLLLRAGSAEALLRGAETATRVFGISLAALVTPLHIASLDDLVAQVAPRARERVAGRTFAARVRRRGQHAWKSQEAERALGAALYADAAGVNLTQPEVEVRVEVYDQTAYLIEQTWEGADGLPLGSQDGALVLMSGGFDSPVAAWMMMRRGVPVAFLHFEMDCAQSEHAMAVCYELWREWGYGTDPVAWTVDFTEVKEALMRWVPSKYRQVTLKRMMLAVSDALAERYEFPALVTGEAVGQVSSQTLANLAEISRGCETLVLRPLTGMTKDEIIRFARRAKTADLSARAEEVCNLADGGPVEVAARRGSIDRTMASLPADIVQHALRRLSVIRIADWQPGREPIPLVPEPPEGVPYVERVEDAPPGVPVAAGGPQAYRVALALSMERPAWIVEPLTSRGDGRPAEEAASPA